MAGPADNRVIDEIGYLVSEFFALRSKDYFSAVERFWRDNASSHWSLIWKRSEPRPGLHELVSQFNKAWLAAYNDAKEARKNKLSHTIDSRLPGRTLSLQVLKEVGWFVYQKACLARDPEHEWQSPIDSNIDPPFALGKSGKRFFSLPEMDLPVIENRAKRSLLWQKWKDKEVSTDEATLEARNNGWAAFPADLVFDTSKIPNQPWLTYCQTVVALVTGDPSDFSVNDFRMSIDAIQQAEHMLLRDGVYKCSVCLLGKRNGEGDPTPIPSIRFHERLSSSLMLNQITFEGSETWTNVSVDVDSAKKWMDHRNAVNTPRIINIDQLKPNRALHALVDGTPKSKRSRSHDENKDDELEEQLRRLKILAESKRAEFSSKRKLAEALSKNEMIKLRPCTIRQIIGGYYPPAQRLAEEGKTDRWWLGFKLSAGKTLKARSRG